MKMVFAAEGGLQQLFKQAESSAEYEKVIRVAQMNTRMAFE